MLKTEDIAFWQTHSIAIVFDNSVPVYCLVKAINIPRLKEIVFQQKIHWSPQLQPKVIFKRAWQVQHEDYAQHEDSTSELVADENDDRTLHKFQNSGYTTCRS